MTLEKITSKAYRLGKKGLAAVLGLHLLTFGANSINSFSNRMAPDEKRATIQDQYGVRVDGWNSEINDDKTKISTIAMVLNKEQIEKPFSISGLNILSKNYLRMSFPDQMEFIVFSNQKDGIANPITYDVGISSKAFKFRDTLHHEIKHIKTYDLSDSNPEFRRQWEELARGPDNKLMYLPQVSNTIKKLRLLNLFFRDETFVSSHELENKGFISHYALTNFYEDVAELCEAIEDSFSDQKFYSFLYNENGNPKSSLLGEKIKLAEKYGLIPKGYVEYVRLQKLDRDTWVYRGGFDVTKAGPFLEESGVFLTQNPNSLFESKIRNQRALLLKATAEQLMWYEENHDLARIKLDDAVTELGKALNVRHKDFDYSMVLNTFENIVGIRFQNPKVALTYAEANYLFTSRFLSGDPLLPIRGVNDYIENKGLMVKN